MDWQCLGSLGLSAVTAALLQPHPGLAHGSTPRGGRIQAHSTAWPLCSLVVQSGEALALRVLFSHL